MSERFNLKAAWAEVERWLTITGYEEKIQAILAPLPEGVMPLDKFGQEPIKMVNPPEGGVQFTPEEKAKIQNEAARGMSGRSEL